MDTEVLALRLGSTVRSTVRLCGLLLVLLGAYHMLAPVVDPTVPQFAPWRQLGYVAIEGLSGLYVGDVVVTVAGAVVTWWV